MHDDDLAGELAALSSDLADDHDEVSTSRLVAERAVEMVRDAAHASVTIRARRRHTTLSASSPLASWADAVQYELGQGPCLESSDGSEWYRSGDVGTDPRWPRWGPAAAEEGIGSVLSIRLLSHGRPFGAMNLYAEGTGLFADPAEVEVAQLFTVHAANALSSARLVSGLETALTSRHRIGVAQGILMCRYELTEAQAFATMRRVSQDTNRRLRDVAADVVDQRRLPAQG